MLTLHDRRKCKQCRYQRCIRAGMNPELVLTEDQKQIRFRKLLLKKKKGPTTRKTNSNTVTDSFSASVAASAHTSGHSGDQTQSLQPRPRKTDRSERSVYADDLSCEQDEYFDLDIFLDEVSTNEVCKDEVSANEMSNDELHNDEVSNDEISNEEVSYNEVSKDKAAKIVALYKAAIQQQTGGQTSEVFKFNLFD